MQTVLVVLCAAFVALLLFAEKTERRALKAASKTAASLSFVACGALSLPLGAWFGKLVLAALVLSAIGDVFLLSHDRRAFLAGLGAFLVAHVAYGAAFVARGVSPFAVEGALLPAILVTALVLAWLLPHVPRAMKGAVTTYAIVIAAMVALAVGTLGTSGGARLVVAALAFWVSDLSVARDRFVAPGFVNRSWGLPLYYAAQLAFANAT